MSNPPDTLTAARFSSEETHASNTVEYNSERSPYFSTESVYVLENSPENAREVISNVSNEEAGPNDDLWAKLDSTTTSSSTPMSVSRGGRSPKNSQNEKDDDEDEVHGNSTSEEEVDDDEDKKDSCSSDPSNSLSTSSSATITNSETKRLKKKAKKKARQMNKENLIKKQRLHRAELQREYDERTATHKKLMAVYAAAVAKPTVSKTIKESRGETHTSTVSVMLNNTTAAYTLTTSAPPTAISSTSYSYSMPVTLRPITEDTSRRRPAPAKQLDATTPAPRSSLPKTRPDTPTPIIVQNSSSSNKEEENKEETNEEEDGEEQVESDEESKQEDVESTDKVDGNPKIPDEFEILVCGERRKVKEFTPRRHLNSASISGDDQDSSAAESSGNSIYDLPEHTPITVPFRQAQIGPSSHSIPNSQPQPNHLNVPNHSNVNVPLNQPIHRFVVPLQLPPPPPVIFHPPIVNSFGPPPYVQFQPRFNQPPISSVNMMPMQPSHHNIQAPSVQMQRMHMPVMMNGPMLVSRPPGPMHAPHMPMQPPHLPPSQMQLQPQPQMRMPPQMFQQPNSPCDFGQPPPPHPNYQHSSGLLPMPTSMPLQAQAQRIPMRSQVYPGQRALSRPIRTPLAITAPPSSSSIPSEVKAEQKQPTEERCDEIPISESLEHAESEDDTAGKEEHVVAVVVEEETTDEVTTPVNFDATPAEEEDKEKEEAEVVVAEQPITHSEQSSSQDVNDDLILAGVAALLDGPDDEIPLPPVIPLPESAPPTDPEQEALNRVLGFSKGSGGEEFAIWTGFMNEMPPRPECLKTDQTYEKMLELDKANVENAKNREPLKTLIIEKKNNHSNLPTICKQILSNFVESGTNWMGEWMDGDRLRQFFLDAYGSSIPYADWRILAKVCSFQPGYFHVFDALIGSKLELTYIYQSHSESDPKEDSLRELWRSMPVVDREDDFLYRFKDILLPSVIPCLPERLVTIRTFISIVKAAENDELTVSDLFYLACLVWGSRQFYRRFNSYFEEIQILETGGKRWIRKAPQPDSSTTSLPVSFRHSHENRAMNVADFLTRLRPHIDDVLQLLPDTVVDDKEFFRAAKLGCGWRGDHEELIWKSIVRDQKKYQEFHDAFRAFLRIEIRMGIMYLRKLAYTDQDIDEDPHLEVIVPDSTSPLPSSFKSKSSKETKKSVTYAVESTRPVDTCTQTDNFDIDKMWDLERELIRQLKRDNTTFEEFIKTEDAREMYQFLADIFKNIDLEYFAYILEKAVAEMREQAWTETVELRVAAEEARRELQVARAEHEQELEEFQNRMETVSRFETYEVQVELRSRIDALKDRIREMTEQREKTVKDEVKEEKDAMRREKTELIADHHCEKRLLQAEIARLKHENGQVLTEEDVRRELASLEEERAQMSARCEVEMNKSRRICEETSSLLRDSQQQIEELRRENQQMREEVSRLNHLRSVQNLSVPPDPDHPSDVFEIVPPAIPSPFELSPRAKIRLSGMEKMQAEMKVHKYRQIARKMYEMYCSIDHVNRKDRKCVEKQLMEFEEKMDHIDNAIEENIELLKLNVVEDLVTIPTIPLPYSETVMRKMNEAAEKYGLTFQVSYHRKESTDDDEEDWCLICYDVVSSGSNSVTCGTCNKKYHQSCISQWLIINSVCPACFRALKDPIEFPTLG